MDPFAYSTTWAGFFYNFLLQHVRPFFFFYDVTDNDDIDLRVTTISYSIWFHGRLEVVVFLRLFTSLFLFSPRPSVETFFFLLCAIFRLASFALLSSYFGQVHFSIFPVSKESHPPHTNIHAGARFDNTLYTSSPNFPCPFFSPFRLSSSPVVLCL